MNRFEKINTKNIDEFAEWLDEHGTYDYSAWAKWWDNNYCLKCESVIAYIPEFDGEHECAWCEINGKCKFFQELDDIPDNKQVIKLWLESEDIDGVQD